VTGAERLIAANAPYWAAEAELCRAYFESPARTLATDLRWLALQASKELVDGVQARADDPEVVAEEVAHLAAFTAAYDRLRPPTEPALTEAVLERSASWPANLALRELRRRHRDEHGTIGFLAGVATEGGAATLFREGAARAGLGPADDVIAEACAAVLADEEEHARHAFDALAGPIDGSPLDDEGWALAARCTVEQSRQRLHMRAEQFGHPVEPGRFEAMLAGEVDPSPVLGVLR
jgi:hypothetical protein